MHFFKGVFHLFFRTDDCSAMGKIGREKGGVIWSNLSATET